VNETGEWSDVDVADTAEEAGSRRRLPAKLRLVVQAGPDKGRELELTRGTFIIGKHPRCALVLTDERVSRRHLEIRLADDGVHVRDLGSRNGSFFRGARFSELVVGATSILTIGQTEMMLVDDSAAPSLPASRNEKFGGLRGRSVLMRQVFAILEQAAPTDAVVLIEGETGTGKELCAEAIHANSPRAGKPFVVFDLASASRSVLEAELFGHTKGAFTGATADRAGAFEAAHGGTLFLDEIGELDLELQPRLLRAIERKQVSRLGESHHRTVDVRFIAATNRDLGEEVKAKRFREDLYHRLAVVRVRLPALRDRKEDLPLLVDGFSEPGSAPVLPETMGLLTDYDWPGNVRELGNVLSRARTMAPAGEPLAPVHLGLDASSASGRGVIERFHSAKEKLIEDWEREFLRKLLSAGGHNLSQAARTSGLGRAHLYRLLKKYKLG
jgi:two-component system nitrogen regulation response regulator GlnG